jgi:hypothetical protein
MKKLSKIFLVPIQGTVEMRAAGELTRVEFIIGTKYFNFSQLKRKIFHHDGVITIVKEEHDIVLMLKAIYFVRYGFVNLHA